MADTPTMKMGEKVRLFIAKNLMAVSIAIFVTFLLFGYFLLFSPELKKIKRANVSKSLESERLAKEAYVQDLKKLAESYATLDEGQVAKLGVMLPESKEIPALLAMFEAAASNSDVSLTNITFSEADLDGAVADISGLKAMNVSLSIANASYTRFKLFLESLEVNLRLFDIRGLSLKPSSAAYDLSIRAYMRGDTIRKN